MKKIIALLCVLATLLSSIAVTVGAEPTCQQVTIPKFGAMPTFDGEISVEEWGEPTVHVVTKGAATEDDNEVGRNDEYGLINTFYWFKAEDKFMNDNFWYDLWLRWDDEYFYIAAKVNDPDPFSQAELWKGDTFRFAVDVKGPSAIVKKTKPEFDYTKDAFPVSIVTPWSSTAVFKALACYYKEKTPTLWRDKGEWDILDHGGIIGVSTTENGDGVTCTNVFEVAVPWNVVAAESLKENAFNDAFVPAAGDVYGVTAMVSCTDCNAYYGWLQWGMGIGSVTEKSSQPRGTRGGSQAMTLGTDVITPAVGYATAKVTETTTIQVEKPLTRPVTTVDSDVLTGEDAKITVDKSGGLVDTDGSSFDGNVIVIAAVAVLALAAVVVVIIIMRKKKNKGE